MTQQAPSFTTVTVIAWISLILAMSCFVVILIDIIKHPQKMKIMNIVWPITALFGSVIWLGAYFKWGRNVNRKPHAFPVSVFIGTCHCGAGCSLADMIGELLFYFVPQVVVLVGYRHLFHERLIPQFIISFILAYAIGIAFQYIAITSMGKMKRSTGLWRAIKADTLSLTSWQIGMYGTIAYCQLSLFPAWLGHSLAANSPVFWLMMQVAMLAGFVIAYPMNWFLIRSGIKEAM